VKPAHIETLACAEHDGWGSSQIDERLSAIGIAKGLFLDWPLANLSKKQQSIRLFC